MTLQREPCANGHSYSCVQRGMEQQAKLAESLLEENEAMARRHNEQVKGSLASLSGEHICFPACLMLPIMAASRAGCPAPIFASRAAVGTCVVCKPRAFNKVPAHLFCPCRLPRWSSCSANGGRCSRCWPPRSVWTP